MSTLITVVIAADPPPRLDKALARDVPEGLGLSRSRLMKLLADGAISVSGCVVTDAKSKVVEGTQIQIDVPQAAPTHIEAEDIPLKVLFEDEALVVVNKPAGMVVHPAPGTPSGTLVNALMYHFGSNLSGVGGVARPGIVHRIDKDTSGVLVVAKSDAAHQGLAAQFEAHTAERKYDAICYGVPDANDPRLRGIRGTSFEPGNVLKISTLLGRHRTDRQKQAVNFDQGRHAVTRVRLDERFGQPEALARVSCALETGRTHQIRVHLAHVGHGLVGDPVYGGKRRFAKGVLSDAAVAAVEGFPRQALHAGLLGFRHPLTGQQMRFDAPPPADIALLLDVLQNASAV